MEVAVATAIPMSWQLTNIAGWVARSITAIFENIGTVQDGMRSIDVPRQMPDPPGARELIVHGGEIRFEDVHFDYGRQPRPGGVLRGIDLVIAPVRGVARLSVKLDGEALLVSLDAEAPLAETIELSVEDSRVDVVGPGEESRRRGRIVRRRRLAGLLLFTNPN